MLMSGWTPRWPLYGKGWGAPVISVAYVLVVQQEGALLHRWWWPSGRRILRWNASTSLLCMEVSVGEIIHRPVGKAVGNLLGWLYIGCVRCELPVPSSCLDVFLYCVSSLLICIYFLPLPSHHGCHRWSSDRGPPLLLFGWTPRWPRCMAWRVGGVFLREVVCSVGLVVLFPSISFALRLPQVIM